MAAACACLLSGAASAAGLGLSGGPQSLRRRDAPQRQSGAGRLVVRSASKASVLLLSLPAASHRRVPVLSLSHLSLPVPASSPLPLRSSDLLSARLFSLPASSPQVPLFSLLSVFL